jgi:hypothetical protein
LIYSMFYGNDAFEIRINEKKIFLQMKPWDTLRN